jgi:hypothetical protein
VKNVLKQILRNSALHPYRSFMMSFIKMREIKSSLHLFSEIKKIPFETSLPKTSVGRAESQGAVCFWRIRRRNAMRLQLRR